VVVRQTGGVPVDVDALKQPVDLLELIGRDTRLRRVASTRGGEYAGPCPFCGGRDCLGDQRWQDAIAYVQRRDGVDDFAEACRRLGASSSELDDGDRHARARRVAAALGLARASEPLLPDDSEPPPVWQAAALTFVSGCEETLWSPVGAQARAYLHQRGLVERTLRSWRIGFQPRYGRYEPAADWGLEGAPVYIPRGIVLSWFTAGCPVHIQVRTSRHDRQERYLSLRGGHPSLFGADTLAPSASAILLEGVLDTLLVWQETGDLLGTASLGSCRKLPSRRALVLERCRPLLEAYDADGEGEAGAIRLHRLLPDLVRVRPPVGKDPTAYSRKGGSVRDWLITALRHQNAHI
jgi:DNA primase